MPADTRRSIRRRAALALVALAVLAPLSPGPALADDDDIVAEQPGVEFPAIVQTGPAPSASAPAPAANVVQLPPQFVESTVNQAGGEDDATRAYQQQEQRRHDDDDGGDARRK